MFEMYANASNGDPIKAFIRKASLDLKTMATIRSQ